MWFEGALLRVGRGASTSLEGGRSECLSFVMAEGGASTWLEGALRRGWRGRFGVAGGGASTWLEGALRRGWRGRFDVV